MQTKMVEGVDGNKSQPKQPGKGGIWGQSRCFTHGGASGIPFDSSCIM